MPATGMSGVDLYARDPQATDPHLAWRWVGTGFADQFPANEKVVADGLPLATASTCSTCRCTMASRRWRSACRRLRPHLHRAPRQAVVFYGTSITQGAAPRARACHTPPSSAAGWTGPPSTSASPAMVRWSPKWRPCLQSSTRRLRPGLPAEPRPRRRHRAHGTRGPSAPSGASGHPHRPGREHLLPGRVAPAGHAQCLYLQERRPPRRLPAAAGRGREGPVLPAGDALAGG